MIRLITALFVIVLFLACKPPVPTTATDAGAPTPVEDAGAPAAADDAGTKTDSGS